MDGQQIVSVLERAGYRLTEPRRALAGLLSGRSGHFTAGQLSAESRTRRPAIGRATIFRTLELLEVLGAIERLDLPSGVHAYVVCEPAHHHHVVCSHCGRTDEIDDSGLRAMVREVTRRTGYRIDDHRLELFGLCPACRASQADPTSMTA